MSIRECHGTSTKECYGTRPPRPSVWGRRVLIINPDLAKAHLLLFELETLGAQGIAVESSAQALIVCPTFKPDVLISTLPLPNEDGTQMLERVKEKLSEQGRKILSISIIPFSWIASQNFFIREKFHYCIIESLNHKSITEQVKTLLSSRYQPT